METTLSLSDNSLASSLSLHRPSSIPQKMGSAGPKSLNTKISASKRDANSHNFNGKLVDESMIVLRRRLHEMTMSEKSHEPPRHWMQWEKEYKKANYDLDVCEAVGYLQYKLMETRPSLALGMTVLIMLSLPTSFALVLFHVMHMIKGL